MIVKTLTIHTADGSTEDVQLGVRIGGVDGYVLWRSNSVTTVPNDPAVIEHVMEEGDVLEIYINDVVGHPVGYYLSGSVLTSL